MENFQRQLQSDAQAVEQRLDEALSETPAMGEIYRPERLINSMRYCVLNGGKRLRPFLVMQAGALFGAKRENLLQTAAALECVHCYSLVHDDLPAMDNDSLRRGYPTVHRAFDEATAILAGDSLLSYAFDLLSNEQAHTNPSVRVRLVSRLAKAVGMGGMAGGQMLDLQPSDSSLEDIARMQMMKTGALMKFACQAGALCGAAEESELLVLGKYGMLTGQAFQLMDDILDATASTERLGKNTEKDEYQGKITQVSILGVEAADQMAQKLVDEACSILTIMDKPTNILEQAVRFAIERKT